MERLNGTLRLMRLALRRDRIKIPVWIVLLLGLTIATVPALQDTYPTVAAREIYATTMNSSMVGRMFGVLDGPSLGSILMVELSSLITLLIAFMATTMIIRHTRHNEDRGSAELMEASATGRFASLSSALGLAVLTSLLIGVATGIILSQFNELPESGAWALGGIFAATGVVYAAVAGVAAQVAGSSRGANALAAGFIAITFLVRAIGDMTGTIKGMSVISTWPSWLSPLGWGQQIHPFTQGNWSIFGMFAALSLFGILAAYLLRSRRDLGAGLLPDRKGPAHAGAFLKNPLGLAWRLQRTTLFWWLLVALVLGVMYGSVTNEFEKMLSSSDAFKQYLSALGGEEKLIDAFLGMTIGLIATAVTAYVLQATLRARSEEGSGRLEPVLGTATPRIGWLLSHSIVVIGGIIGIMLMTGLATSISYVLVTDTAWGAVRELTIASLAYVPALLLMWGFTALLIGLLPRLAGTIGWLLFVAFLLLAQLGALLKLPSWIMSISPFGHVPNAPLEDLTITPLVILMGLALIFAIIGLVAFRNRDLTTS